MRKPVVIIGMGEMGGVFARGFLKAGYPVYPVNRGARLAEAENRAEDAAVVIVAVGEKGLPDVLKNMPDAWKDRIVLLQNELLPQDWQKYDLNPTVISVWFEKKKPYDYKVIVPSPVFGPRASLVAEALMSIEIPVQVLSSADELLFELVVKNLYILTTNISGLSVGGNVGELWGQHRDFAQRVAGDILDVQFSLVGCELDRSLLIAAMVRAFNGDPEHKCMGRSAPARLQRALEQADAAQLAVPILREISRKRGGS